MTNVNEVSLFDAGYEYLEDEMKSPKKWYVASMGSDPHNQGLVVDKNTGENIAVTYKSEHAPIVAAAPELLNIVRAFALLNPFCLRGVIHCGECAACQADEILNRLGG